MGCGQSLSTACPRALSSCFGKKGSSHQSESPSTRTVTVQSKPMREVNTNVDAGCNAAAAAASAAKVVSSKTSRSQPSSQMQPISASNSQSYDAPSKSTAVLPTPKNSPDTSTTMIHNDNGEIEFVPGAGAPLLGGRALKNKFASMSSRSMSSLSLGGMQRKRVFCEPEDSQFCDDSVINGERDLQVLHQQLEMVSQSLTFSLAMELIRNPKPKFKLVAPLPKECPASPHGIKRSITSTACGESS